MLKFDTSVSEKDITRIDNIEKINKVDIEILKKFTAYSIIETFNELPTMKVSNSDIYDLHELELKNVGNLLNISHMFLDDYNSIKTYLSDEMLLELEKECSSYFKNDETKARALTICAAIRVVFTSLDGSGIVAEGELPTRKLGGLFSLPKALSGRRVAANTWYNQLVDNYVHGIRTVATKYAFDKEFLISFVLEKTAIYLNNSQPNKFFLKKGFTDTQNTQLILQNFLDYIENSSYYKQGFNENIRLKFFKKVDQ